jgi:hypothetical protein
MPLTHTSLFGNIARKGKQSSPSKSGKLYKGQSSI